MTYGEASTSRTAIGSALIYHGVREVSRHDLNKHLVLLFLTKQICCEYIWADVKHISIWNQGACIGLYFINRPEWIIVDHACSAYSYVSVPLYDTLGMFTTEWLYYRSLGRSWFVYWQFLFILHLYFQALMLFNSLWTMQRLKLYSVCLKL